MKVWKKLSALALSLMLVLALCAPAFAEGEITPAELDEGTGDTAKGEIGGFVQDDTPLTTVTKAVNIKKEITVYNPDKSMVYGPAITYTYEVVPASGTELVTITDDTADHANEVAVVRTALAGVTTNVTVNSGTPGTDTLASGTLTWTNADILDAGSSGVANLKDVTIDFSKVVFTTPGVYRYKITETANNYTTAGVIDGNGDSNANVRYLDVYVMRSASYSNGNTATEWTIYGYVCVEGETAPITTNTTKTNGFVNSATSGSNADQYRTYNLTVKKTLSNDTSMESHQFPFTVAFAHTAKTGTFQLIAEKDTGVTAATTAETAATTLGGTAITANSLLKIGNANTFTNLGNFSVKIAHNNNITFIGIPNGTTVTVTETNDVTGTTYSTSATLKVGDGDATAVTLDSTGSLSSDNKSASIDADETATYTGTATTDNTNVEIVFTNLLSLISPTGVTLRYAPYMAMMGLGIVALPLSLRKKEELD